MDNSAILVVALGSMILFVQGVRGGFMGNCGSNKLMGVLRRSNANCTSSLLFFGMVFAGIFAGIDSREYERTIQKFVNNLTVISFLLSNLA